MIERLYEHQERGARFLRSPGHNKAALFFEVGTGKTNTAIAAVNELPKGKLLILAPASVIHGMWERYDDLPIKHDYTLMTYEMLSRHKEYTKLSWDYIICDECHKLKSVKSKVSKYVKVLSARAKICWGLTGTPIATDFCDIHGIFTALSIDEFNMGADTFMHRYYQCKVVFSGPNYMIYKPQKLLPGAMEELTTRIAKHAMTLRSEDCVDLPGVTIKQIPVAGMNGPEYKEIAKSIIQQGDDQPDKVVNKLVQIGKLHQAANGFVYNEQKVAIPFEKNPKLDIFKMLIQMALEERERVIVIYEYVYDYTKLTEVLDSLGITYTNDHIGFEFNQVLLMQEASAIGINLQKYTSCMIYYSYSYSYLEYDQSLGRIYRMGQARPCEVYFMVSSNTIEQKIAKVVMERVALDEAVKELLVALTNEAETV